MNLFPFKILRVLGHSMEPTIRAGSYVLINTWIKKYKVEDIIAFDFNNSIYIKRIVAIDSESIIVHGDNRGDSFDSRNFGKILKSQVIGIVSNHY